VSQRPVRLSRWLVVSLLSISVLAVLGAGAWWWVTWPERTAKEFVDLVCADRLDDARNMLQAPFPDRGPVISLDFTDAVLDPSHGTEHWVNVHVYSKQRDRHEVLLGRQPFTVREAAFEFSVQRGRVILPARFWVRPYGSTCLMGYLPLAKKDLIESIR
jgi:hypothetical protein